MAGKQWEETSGRRRYDNLSEAGRKQDNAGGIVPSSVPSPWRQWLSRWVETELGRARLAELCSTTTVLQG